MNTGIENFPQIVETITNGISNGLHTCTQVHIRQYGEVIADFALGEFSPGKKCSEKTVMPWMSCTKMINAIAFGILVDRGKVDFDQKVAEIIPEFAAKGKKNISFTHILNHTAGIRILSAKWDKLTWEESIHAVCAMPVETDWQIGVDGGYHIATSWFILGEAIQRLSGMPLERFVEKEIFTPLEMKKSFISATDKVYNTFSDIARFYRTDIVPIRPAVDKYSTSANRCRPGSSGHGPINELASFMEMLYEGGTLNSSRIISENTLSKMIRPSRIGIKDKTFEKVIDWGLGFMIDSKKYQRQYPYSFGPGCSSETFGHNGNQS